VKRYFAQLRPLERRLAVGVMVALFLVLNYVFIWPHFSDWTRLRYGLEDARQKLVLYRTTIAQSAKYATLVKEMEGQGGTVAPEDQAINFIHAIQAQSARSGVGIINMPRQMTRTNEFFVELAQNITITASDEQLVDFLYRLGSDASMIRVSDLELQPDPPRQHLNGNIRLIASYQKATAKNDSKNKPQH
jgi:type II secretory pathway component PulM